MFWWVLVLTWGSGWCMRVPLREAVRRAPAELPKHLCHDAGTIPTPEDFYAKHIRARQPGVFRGLGVGSLASKWTDAVRVQARFGQEVFAVELRKEQFAGGDEPPTKEQMSMSRCV